MKCNKWFALMLRCVIWRFRYRKVSGDSCSGGDVEARLDGEMLPCPVGGTVRASSSAYTIIFSKLFLCNTTQSYGMQLEVLESKFITQPQTNKKRLHKTKLWGRNIFVEISIEISIEHIIALFCVKDLLTFIEMSLNLPLTCFFHLEVRTLVFIYRWT